MSETTIINGQPQGLGNRMVTHDGLVDFLKMLKNEIPRMGANNTIAEGAPFSYAIGNNNTLGESDTIRSGQGYIFGSTNTIRQNTFKDVYILGSGNESIRPTDGFDSLYSTYILGSSNTSINHTRNTYIFGTYNTAQGKGYTDSLINAYGFGNNLTLTSNAVWLGSYNNPKSDVVFGIGNGRSEQPSNLFEITNDGQIRLGTTSISESLLSMHDGTVLANKIQSIKMVTDEFYAEDSKGDSQISIDNIQLSHTQDPDGQEDGIGLRNRSSYYDEGDGDFYPLNDPDEPILLNGGLRPVFRPWYNNEMLWVTNIHQSNKEGLHINYTDQETLNKSYNPHWHIPSTILFHAGGENTWATLKCKQVIVTDNVHGIVNFSGPQGGDYIASWKVYFSGLYSLQLINDATLKESGIIYIDVNNTSQITIGGVLFRYSQGVVTATYHRGQDSNTDTIAAVQYAQLTVEGEEIKKE